MTMYKKKTIDANELVDELGFKMHQARDIIRLAKVTMVNRGYSMYNNKRLGVVPRTVVEELTGISLNKEETEQ
ncbi:DUF3173 family protein [Ligilactobacillus agilis]|nr:DUF3173 family protein [Ligilactobacillus agilis]